MVRGRSGGWLFAARKIVNNTCREQDALFVYTSPWVRLHCFAITEGSWYQTLNGTFNIEDDVIQDDLSALESRGPAAWFTSRQRNRPIDTPSNQSAFKKTTTQLLPLVVSAPARSRNDSTSHVVPCPNPVSVRQCASCSCASPSDTKPNKPTEELRNKGIRARQSVVDGWPAKVDAAAATTRNLESSWNELKK